jgi:hypothetical protein
VCLACVEPGRPVLDLGPDPVAIGQLDCAVDQKCAGTLETSQLQARGDGRDPKHGRLKLAEWPVAVLQIVPSGALSG